MSPRERRLSLWIASAVVLLLGLLEAATRASGLADFPIFVANREIGYIPAPSQSGTFINKNHWRFNAKSMGAAEFQPSDALDTILVGDSVVAGGNPFDEKDRLGPQLQSVMKSPVWPVSAGSWSLRNQLKYFKIHPDVAESADQFIFVLNSADFDEAASWSCEKSHPLSRPTWATLFAFRKYVWDWKECGGVPTNLLVPSGDWKVELRDFLLNNALQGKQVLVVLYPTKNEVETVDSLYALEAHTQEFVAASAGTGVAVTVFSLGRYARWSTGLYRDEIHPSVEGTRVLAALLTEMSGQLRSNK